MSSGLRVIPQQENPAQSPIKIWWLLDQLEKKKINQKLFAQKLGISVSVLTGKTRAGFPADKVDECMKLLENWENTRLAPSGGLKSAAHPWSGSIFTNGKRKTTP